MAYNSWCSILLWLYFMILFHDVSCYFSSLISYFVYLGGGHHLIRRWVQTSGAGAGAWGSWASSWHDGSFCLGWGHVHNFGGWIYTYDLALDLCLVQRWSYTSEVFALNRCRALAWSGSVPFLAYSCTGWQWGPSWLASLLPQGVCVCVCVYKAKKISVLARGLSAGAGEAGTGTCCALTCMLEWSWQSIQSTRKFSICCLCAETGSMHSSRAES